MRTIAICNLKGGVGTTTLTFGLATALAEQGRRVLVIDADAQGSLTECFNGRRPGFPTLAEVLRGQATVATATRPTEIDGISLLASSPHLDTINHRTLVGERVLLARMHDTYDYTLIDCPSTTGVVLLNAFIAADEILAPVQARGMARAGIRRLLQVIGELRDRATSARFDLTGIVVNQFVEGNPLACSVLGSLQQTYGRLVFKTLIHDADELAEAADARVPIGDFAPGSTAAAEMAALARELHRSRHRGRGHFNRQTGQAEGPFLVPPAAAGSSGTGRH